MYTPNHAIAYDSTPIPRLTINSRTVEQEDLEFDMQSSEFSWEKKRVQEIYGNRIACPEETEDPEGHMEAGVGFAKFMKFAERVMGEWGKVL
jgi:hypothetical protein